MANGRLGSVTVNPYAAGLVYSNTSGSAAAINVQATDLSTTTNAQFSLAVDSASISVNQTTTAVSMSSGNTTGGVWWLDPVSKTTPVKFMFQNKTQGDGNFTNNYWNGSAWATSGSAGTIGNFPGIKIDPYFYTNFSEYNAKTAPVFMVPMAIAGNNTSARLRTYNLNVITGSQLGRILLADETTGATTAGLDTGASYQTCGQDADMYTDISVGCNADGYQGVYRLSGGESTRTSGSIIYQSCGGSSIAGANAFWFAPRFMVSNGFYVIQATGHPYTTFAIADQELANLTGDPSNAFNWVGSASGARWSGFNPSGSQYDISWFEWNPNTERFYMEWIGGGRHQILSASKAEIRAVQFGTTTSSNLSVFRQEAATTPWTGSNYIQRPRRIGRSLWQAISNNGNAYVSTDLINWTVATTYWPTLGLPATTTTFNGLSATSYLYLGAGVANVNQFASGFSSVSQTATIEHFTTFSNYQRTGLVLSSGDKLYCQNYGSVAFSINVMGYEG
jgi:hypothetical protein